ncbi:MAG: hypothetical protein AAF526_12240 [Pseudomonadota bacterium]
MRLNLAAAMAVASGLALHGPAQATSPEEVLDQARSDCNGLDNGILEAGEDAIVRVDVSGDGQPDEIVDANHLSCTSARSLFCGTGGCAVTVIVDGTTTEFLAKGWQVVDFAGSPVFLLAVHGSECGGDNTRRCVIAHVWQNDRFNSTLGN